MVTLLPPLCSYLVSIGAKPDSDGCPSSGKGAAAGPSSTEENGRNGLGGETGSGSASNGSIGSSSSGSVSGVGPAMETAPAGVSPGVHAKEGASGSSNNEAHNYSSGPEQTDALMGNGIGVPMHVAAGEQREAGARVGADLEGGGELGPKAGAEEPSKEVAEGGGGRDEVAERAKEGADGKDGGVVRGEGAVCARNGPAEAASERSQGGPVDGAQADAMSESMADPEPSANGGEDDAAASEVGVNGAQKANAVSPPPAASISQPAAPSISQPAAAGISQPAAPNAAVGEGGPDAGDVCAAHVPLGGAVEHEGFAAAGAAPVLADGNAPPAVQGSNAGAPSAAASQPTSPVESVSQEESVEGIMEGIIDALPPGFVRCPGCPMVRCPLRLGNLWFGSSCCVEYVVLKGVRGSSFSRVP